jgi:hypothetical protein
VAAHHQPGGGAAVEGCQVSTDEVVLRAARLKQVLCKRSQSAGQQRQQADGCSGDTAAARLGTAVLPLRRRISVSTHLPPQSLATPLPAALLSRAAIHPPVEYCKKWMGPKSKLYQGWSSAGVGMRVRR